MTRMPMTNSQVNLCVVNNVNAEATRSGYARTEGNAVAVLMAPDGNRHVLLLSREKRGKLLPLLVLIHRRTE